MEANNFIKWPLRFRLTINSFYSHESISSALPNRRSIQLAQNSQQTRIFVWAESFLFEFLYYIMSSVNICLPTVSIWILPLRNCSRVARNSKHLESLVKQLQYFIQLQGLSTWYILITLSVVYVSLIFIFLTLTTLFNKS